MKPSKTGKDATQVGKIEQHFIISEFLTSIA